MADLMRLIAAERLALIELLETLTPTEWPEGRRGRAHRPRRRDDDGRR